jgi:hypothetical protein
LEIEATSYRWLSMSCNRSVLRYQYEVSWET